jgi:hypothetical protein
MPETSLTRITRLLEVTGTLPVTEDGAIARSAPFCVFGRFQDLLGDAFAGPIRKLCGRRTFVFS